MDFEIRMAKKYDAVKISNIYKSLIGVPGCAWNENYPTLEDVENDISKNSLYVLCHSDEIIAAAAALKDDELNELTCWGENIKYPCELARIGVSVRYQNKGIAKELLKYIEKDVLNRGFDGIHFLVSKTNQKALSLYNGLGYHKCGETNMYDLDWFCYEKKL